MPAIAEVPKNEKAPNSMAVWSKVPAPRKWLPVPETAMPEPIDCNWCWGTGKDPQDRRRKCVGCDGARKMPDCKSNTKLRRAHFANRYLALIQGWKIAPNGEKIPAWIRNGDALGLLAPMRS